MRVAVSLVLFPLLAVCSSAFSQTVKACGGDGNWPPMSYASSAGAAVEGLSVDILGAILTPRPIVELRPWARCLYEVQAHQGYDIAMSIFKTPEREKTFLFSDSYLSLTPSYLYAVGRYAAPPVSRLDDLARFRICALHGASISYTGLQASVIDSGANNYSSLIKKIDRGYCDVVVDMREVFQGFANLGMLPFDSKLYRILPIPETEKYPLHFAISREHPNAALLMTKINQGLSELKKNGQLASIIRDYKLQQN